MKTAEATATVYLPQQSCYEFLLDFPRYAKYSEYLTGVDQYGDGGPGTEYDMAFSWWRLSYTARSRVTAVDPPERIEFDVLGRVTASGYWAVESAPEAAPEGHETASRVTFHVRYDPGSVDAGVLRVPGLPVGRVRSRLSRFVREEVERIVRRVVADLEGRRRHVDLAIRTDGAGDDAT